MRRRAAPAQARAPAATPRSESPPRRRSRRRRDDGNPASSIPPTGRCSATCWPSSRSTAPPHPSASIASCSSGRSRSPASATPTSAAAPARTSSSTRSRWRRSAPGCASTPRRCARRCCTTPSRTRARAWSRSQEAFGEEIARLVDGVTKLTGLTFASRDESQAENYRKMMVAMAADVRVILIKLADRLHNMRTLVGAAEAEAAREVARDARDLRAARPPARHPRDQVGAGGPRVRRPCTRASTRRSRSSSPSSAQERERYVDGAGRFLRRELKKVGIEAEISGRAKHFYSIYSKMTKKGREFNEIYDLTAMRVIVGSVKDCYGAIGIIHSIWKPLPGRFKDFIATPKSNLYQALHTTVIGPEGRPLEIQIRTREMHELAEYGIAAHVIYKEGVATRGDNQQLRKEKMTWLRPAARGGGRAGPVGVPRGAQGRPLRGRGVRLHAEGRGEEPLRRLDPARLRLRGPHRRRPPLRRREGERQDRAAALPARSRRHRRDPDREAGARAVARLAQRSCGRPARATRSAPS